MNPGGLEDTPQFYDSLTDRPYTDRLHTGSEFGFTVPTILEEIRERRTLEKGQRPQFFHTQKRICEPVVRYRLQGSEEWTTIPTVINIGGTIGTEEWVLISNITDEYVELDWFKGSFGVEEVVDIEINLLDFHI